MYLHGGFLVAMPYQKLSILKIKSISLILHLKNEL